MNDYWYNVLRLSVLNSFRHQVSLSDACEIRTSGVASGVACRNAKLQARVSAMKPGLDNERLEALRHSFDQLTLDEAHAHRVEDRMARIRA
eukprot:3095498-Prymnesium_polylepis.1